MFDVLPPSPSGGQDDLSQPKSFLGSRRIRPNRPAARTVQPATGASSARPSVVSLSWKLPARLRKPIRQQLQKERQKKQAREAIVRFERRPLTTRRVVDTVSGVNIGAEHHTGDVYQAAPPKLKVALPPYAGKFGRSLSGSKPSVRPKRNVSAPRVSRQPLNPHVAPKQQVLAQQSPPVLFRARTLPMPSAQEVIGMERDMPYAWQTGQSSPVPHISHRQDGTTLQQTATVEPLTASKGAIEQPKRRFALPFAVSFWPTSLFSSKKKFRERLKGSGTFLGVPSQIVANSLFLAVGSLAIMGFVWSLQGAGRGTAVLSSVEGKASDAYGKLMQAQAAFASTDFTAGQEHLSQAGTLLGSARDDLSKALSATEHVLRVLDVTGTVRSGDQLLLAGQQLSEAGEHIARGAGAFFDVDIFAGKIVPKDAPPTTTLVEALQFATQEFQVALPQLTVANDALAKVESPFLPQEVASEVTVLQTAVPRVITFLQEFVRQSGTLGELLGARQPRQYLLLFANQDELRPVGGFIGSIGLVNVDKGQVENVDVSSVYDPDGQLKEFIAPPDALLPITSRWYMRDANWFVDYEVSAKKISQFFEKEGGPTVDGVILLTPEVIKNLLTITGPLSVPGHDVQLTAENFQQVTQDEVTYSYDRTVNRPKQFLADVAPLLLNRLFSQEGGSRSYGAVMRALSDAAHTKDLLLYFRDSDVQQQVREAGWAGNIPANVPGLLYVNNANIGGHKSDKFVDQEIDYRVEVGKDGKAEAVVTIRRTHHGPDEKDEYTYPDYENPHFKDNIIFQRVLVPAGSRLLEAKGYTPASAVPRIVLPKAGEVTKPDNEVAAWQSSMAQDSTGTMIGSESGYTFFANWILTKPGQTTVTLYRYELPQRVELPQLVSPAAHYSMTVVKQPGAQRTNVRASLKLPEGMSIVHAVPPTGITQESEREFVYRGALRSDIIVGGVFEKR